MGDHGAVDSSGSSRLDRPISSLYFVALAGLVAAVVVFLGIYAVLPEPERLNLLAEIATAAIGFVPLIFFSVVVAGLVQRRDAEKARRERRLEARREFRSRAIRAYNESKSTRRILRASGLRPDSGTTLTEENLRTLDEQLSELIDAQLTMEQLKREVGAPAAPFDDRERLRALLETIEKYLNRVVKDWEAGRPALRAGSPATDLARWPHYADFVAAKDAARLPDSPTSAFKDLESAVLRELEA